jgi:hypothetical protein
VDWQNLITNLGFPIAMCIYFVRRIEQLEKKSDSRQEELLNVIKQNTSAMVTLNSSLKGRPCLHSEANPMGENDR